MRSPHRWIVPVAAAVALAGLAGLGALWWRTPVELRIEVAQVEGSPSNWLSIAVGRVLGGDERYGDTKTIAMKTTQDPDDRTLTLQVPRGTYKVYVEAAFSEKVSRTVRVRGATTVHVTPQSHLAKRGTTVQPK